MDPCACDRVPSQGDRFCAGCGAGLATDVLPAASPSGRSEDRGGRLQRFAPRAPRFEHGGAGDGILLEGTISDAPARSESDARSPARLRWVLLAVAALGATIIWFSQWQRGDATPAADPEVASAADDEAAGTESDEPADTEAVEEGESEDGPAVPGTTATDDDRADEDQVRPPGPVLGRETGLGVIVGRSSSRQLRLLNLDTGEERELAARGELLGLLGRSLVLNRNGRIELVPLDSPDGEGRSLPSSANGLSEVVALGRELVWVTEFETDATEETEGSDEFIVRGYDEAGTEVDRTRLDRFTFYPGLAPESGLAQTRGGGIYRRTGDDYRRLSTGALISVGVRLALVTECDDSMRCRFNWYETADWSGPLDLPEPDVSEQSWTSLHADDRWLAETIWQTGTTSLVEVATGQVVRTLGRSNDGPSRVTAIPFSPDGRWLMESAAGGLQFVDMDTGEEFPYRSDGISGRESGVFVNLDDVGTVP